MRISGSIMKELGSIMKALGSIVRVLGSKIHISALISTIVSVCVAKSNFYALFINFQKWIFICILKVIAKPIFYNNR